MMDNPTFIEVYDNALDTLTCEKICMFMDTKKNDALFEKDKARDFYSLFRPSIYGSFKPYNTILLNTLKKYLNVYGKKYNMCPKNMNHFEDHWKLQKSPAGGGFVKWHCEQGAESYAQGRYLVWMIYLNDTIGGETEFQYQNYSCRPIPGRLVIWPGAWTHPHRQKDNLQSVKYIATGWWRYE